MNKPDNMPACAASIWEVGTTDPDGSVVRMELWADRRMARAYAESLAEQIRQTCFVARLDLMPSSRMYIQRDVEPVLPPKPEDYEDTEG